MQIREQNLLFIGRLAPQILAIELHLRDRVAAMRPDEYRAACAHLEAPNLGDLVRVIVSQKLENAIFNKFTFDFKRYFAHNPARMRTLGGRFGEFLPHTQAKIALDLLRTVRNRAFHGGDLLALHTRADGSKAPRIFTQERFGEQVLNFGVLPERIERLLAGIAAATCVSGYTLYISGARE